MGSKKFGWKMSRFPGWTEKDIAKLQLKDVKIEKKPKVKKSKGPDYVGMISSALTMLKIEHEREYKFLHDRRFRFDIAIPAFKIAIEFEGGIYTGGRHVRGTGYARDAKKYNLATMHGWKLLRFTSADVKTENWEFEAADQVKQLIENQRGI